MIENIRSVYIFQKVLFFLKEKVKLKIIAYNKSLQAKCFIDILLNIKNQLIITY